jgi:hypothetical protein
VYKAPHLVFAGALLTLRWTGARARAQCWGFTALGVAISLGALVSWNYLNRASVTSGNDDVGRQLAWLGAHWDEIPTIALNTLGDRGDDYLIQFVAFRDVIHRQMTFSGAILAGLYLPLLFALTLGAATEQAHSEPRLRWGAAWIALLGLVSAAGVFLAMYLFASAFSSDRVMGVQGRYFIPIVPALLILLGCFGNHGPGRWLEARAGIRLKVAMGVLNALTLLALIARYYASPELADLY